MLAEVFILSDACSTHLFRCRCSKSTHYNRSLSRSALRVALRLQTYARYWTSLIGRTARNKLRHSNAFRRWDILKVFVGSSLRLCCLGENCQCNKCDCD